MKKRYGGREREEGRETDLEETVGHRENVCIITRDEGNCVGCASRKLKSECRTEKGIGCVFFCKEEKVERMIQL